MEEETERPAPIFEQVVTELHSSYGDTLSSTRPYKIVRSVELASVWETGDKTKPIKATISISAQSQSPYGDIYDYDTKFNITMDDIALITSAANVLKDPLRLIGVEMKKAAENYAQKQDSLIRDQIAEICRGIGQPKTITPPKRIRLLHL